MWPDNVWWVLMMLLSQHKAANHAKKCIHEVAWFRMLLIIITFYRILQFCKCIDDWMTINLFLTLIFFSFLSFPFHLSSCYITRSPTEKLSQDGQWLIVKKNFWYYNNFCASIVPKILLSIFYLTIHFHGMTQVSWVLTSEWPINH